MERQFNDGLSEASTPRSIQPSHSLVDKLGRVLASRSSGLGESEGPQTGEHSDFLRTLMHAAGTTTGTGPQSTSSDSDLGLGGILGRGGQQGETPGAPSSPGPVPLGLDPLHRPEMAHQMSSATLGRSKLMRSAAAAAVASGHQTQPAAQARAALAASRQLTTRLSEGALEHVDDLEAEEGHKEFVKCECEKPPGLPRAPPSSYERPGIC